VIGTEKGEVVIEGRDSIDKFINKKGEFIAKYL